LPYWDRQLRGGEITRLCVIVDEEEFWISPPVGIKAKDGQQRVEDWTG
jgi:hypothetical protein